MAGWRAGVGLARWEAWWLFTRVRGRGRSAAVPASAAGLAGGGHAGASSTLHNNNINRSRPPAATAKRPTLLRPSGRLPHLCLPPTLYWRRPTAALPSSLAPLSRRAHHVVDGDQLEIFDAGLRDAAPKVEAVGRHGGVPAGRLVAQHDRVAQGVRLVPERQRGWGREVKRGRRGGAGATGWARGMHKRRLGSCQSLPRPASSSE